MPDGLRELSDKSHLSRLFAKLPKGRSAGIVAAAGDKGLWIEALDLLHHLNKPQRREMVLAALTLHERAREGLLETIITNDLTDEVRLIAEHDDSIEERLAEHLRRNG